MYFTWLSKLIKKRCICNDLTIRSSTFFITFIGVESKWLPLFKCLYDLNSKNLGINIPFDKIKPKHVANFIWCDPIAYARYYDHCMRFFHTLYMKDNSILWHLLKKSLLQKFKIMEINMTMDFYGLQMHQFMVWIQTMQLKFLWTNIYHVIIIN